MVQNIQELQESLRGDKDIKLESDILVEGVCIDKYTGFLDGNGYTIQFKSQDLFIKEIGTTGVITDCCFEGSISSKEDTVSIIKENNGVIEDCTVDIGVVGEDRISSLVVENHGCIQACTSASDIEGQEEIGGLVVENRGRIQNSTFTGYIQGDSHTGGVVGLRSLRWRKGRAHHGVSCLARGQAYLPSPSRAIRSC